MEFCVKLVEGFNVGSGKTRFGFVTFSNWAENIFYLDSYDNIEDMKNAIVAISYVGGSTNTYAGLREMHNTQFVESKGDRPGIPNIAILITDGASNIESEQTIPEAEAAREDGILIFSIGVNAFDSEEEIKLVSSQPQLYLRNYFLFPSYENLPSAHFTADFLREVCVGFVDELYCKDTGENGLQCFCTYGTCDIRPTNSTSCFDIIECHENNGGCQQNCVNTHGSFFCYCNIGYELRTDQRSCKDVNECLDNPCYAGQE